MSALSFDVTPTLQFLRARRAELDAAIAALEALSPIVAPKIEASAKVDALRIVPKKPTKAKAPELADDEPIVRKGRMPSVGVQHHFCADESERREKVDELKSSGLRRAGVMERLLPGLFDVRPSADEDGSATVLWIEKAEAA